MVFKIVCEYFVEAMITVVSFCIVSWVEGGSFNGAIDYYFKHHVGHSIVVFFMIEIVRKQYKIIEDSVALNKRLSDSDENNKNVYSDLHRTLEFSGLVFNIPSSSALKQGAFRFVIDECIKGLVDIKAGKLCLSDRRAIYKVDGMCLGALKKMAFFGATVSLTESSIKFFLTPEYNDFVSKVASKNKCGDVKDERIYLMPRSLVASITKDHELHGEWLRFVELTASLDFDQYYIVVERCVSVVLASGVHMIHEDMLDSYDFIVFGECAFSECSSLMQRLDHGSDTFPVYYDFNPQPEDIGKSVSLFNAIKAKSSAFDKIKLGSLSI